MTWQSSNYPSDTKICPHCGKSVGNSFDFHEILTHPDKRNYPEEYIKWLQSYSLDKKKTKKKK